MSNYADSHFNFDDENSSWVKTFKLIPDKSLVIDVGCSSGNFGEHLSKAKGCTVDGIEIADDDIKRAKKKLRHVYKLDIERDDIDITTKYDVMFLGDVIEHLARPVDTLARLRSLLKPNGVLVFSLPNITHMSVRLMLLKGKIEYGRTGLLDETHLHFYNSEEIHRVLAAAGYEVVNFDYTVNDVPYELAEREFTKLGLKPQNKFKQLLSSTNAAAYQFVGLAKTSNVKKQQLPKSSPSNLVDSYIKELKRDYDKVIFDLQKHVKDISADRDRIILDRDRINRELNELREYMSHGFISNKLKGLKRRATQHPSPKHKDIKK